MTHKTIQKEGIAVMKNTILFIMLIGLGSILLTTNTQAQPAKPSPSPAATNKSEPKTWYGYEITSSIELGVRGINVDGNHEKWRSDFNYQPGFRVFDSSFLMEDKEGKQGVVDSLLVTSSGWGGDPTGYTRLNMEKTGLYRLDAQVRKSKYFNYLTNHARGLRYSDIKRDFGDFDFTLFPERENFRLRFGASYTHSSGTGSTGTRFGDEFRLPSNVEVDAKDFRVGVDFKLAGFKMQVTQGYRRFSDETTYQIPTTDEGTDPTNTNRIYKYDRIYPIKGHTNWSMFNVNRTFAGKLDFTGRLIYSNTKRDFNFLDVLSGLQSTTRYDSDKFEVFGEATSPQARADIGLTYAVTNDFRISETFTFDRFNVGGGSSYLESRFTSNNNTNAVLAPVFSSTNFYRLNNFRRYINTIEGDYQFNNHVGINIGYRYSHRKVEERGFDLNFPTASSPTIVNNNPSLICPNSTTATNPITYCGEEENTTNALIAGTRIKPMKYWSIFADLEHGTADNAFVRLSNYNFTNFRIRSRWNYHNFGISASFISKNNENPSTSTATPEFPTYPSGEIVGNTKSRIFSGSFDWTPISKFSLSTGYTLQHLTSDTDIVISTYNNPPATTTALILGTSRYYMRDHYGFFDVSARPWKRVSIFASYRISKDTGQGNRVQTTFNDLISSYPYTLITPEVRVAFRLTKNIDWNVGYQYYNYKEDIAKTLPNPTLLTGINGNPAYAPLGVVAIPPNQNYKANAVYTSLRIYFGGNRER